MLKFVLGLGIFVVAMTFVGILQTKSERIPPPCVDEGMREQIRTIMLAGLDSALKEHTGTIYGTWLKDRTHQPERAIAGMRIGIEAYIRSKHAVLAWSPAPCPEN